MFMSEHLYILTICLPLGTVLLIFGLRYLAAVQQAKARLAGDQAYREISEQTLTVLVEVRARLDGIEKILKAVE
ncbi:hypothetical protein ASD21_10060 [Caulobacter sp. Root1455]|jgi:hypothetical protein|nr:hypothetical protein ASD38_17060 [Caulobacter sp. Root487D2Y]KQY93921.1 hypothetical protein ASD21_10060 [Caulobacter sp. Root1455]